MERFCFFDERKVQFLSAELRVRARLAGKGKGALAARVERHECQRRESILRHDNAARIHADLAQRPGEHRAEGVRAHLAQKRRPAAEPRDGREEIGGRTAGMRRHERIAVRSRPLRRKVDEQLAKRNDVVLRPRHPLPSPRSHSSRSASR